MVEALRSGDVAGAAGLMRDDVAWLGPTGTDHGAGAAAARLRDLAGAGREWAAPQQQGAKAVLRHTSAHGGSGTLVVEVRRGKVVFAAESG